MFFVVFLLEMEVGFFVFMVDELVLIEVVVCDVEIGLLKEDDDGFVKICVFF